MTFFKRILLLMDRFLGLSGNFFFKRLFLPVDKFRAVSDDFGELDWLIFKLLGTPNLPAHNMGFARLGQTKLGSTFGILFIFCTFTQLSSFNVPNLAKPYSLCATA